MNFISGCVGLIQQPGPKCETMGNAHARGIFRPVQFLGDTFTAEDLESDNTRQPQCAEESDSECSEPQERDGPINAKKSSECGPLYNPTTHFMGERSPLSLMCGSLITFWYQTPFPLPQIFSPKTQTLCVSKKSSSPRRATQTFHDYQEEGNHPNVGF